MVSIADADEEIVDLNAFESIARAATSFDRPANVQMLLSVIVREKKDETSKKRRLISASKLTNSILCS